MKQTNFSSNEIDSVLTEMTRRDSKLSAQVPDSEYLKTSVRAGLYSSYIPPYRATYMKTHNMEP